MRFAGILLGIFTMLSIGLGHVWVIKVEYHIGAHVWPVPVIIGAALVLASLWVDHVFLSAALGIFGFTVLWGAHELVRQEKRVERGWFPRNPRKRPPQIWDLAIGILELYSYPWPASSAISAILASSSGLRPSVSASRKPRMISEIAARSSIPRDCR